jgi:hypothetical protein
MGPVKMAYFIFGYFSMKFGTSVGGQAMHFAVEKFCPPAVLCPGNQDGSWL